LVARHDVLRGGAPGQGRRLLYGDSKGDGTWFAGTGSFAGQLGSRSANVAP
jgi:hypothetical protein